MLEMRKEGSANGMKIVISLFFLFPHIPEMNHDLKIELIAL